MRQIVRRVRRRFVTMHAPKVAVRVALPWYLRWTGLAALCAMVGAAAWWSGRQVLFAESAPAASSAAPVSQVVEVPAAPGPNNERAEALGKLAKDLRAQLDAAQRQATMDKAAQAELTKSLNKAQEEIARLREDLGLYQSSVQAGATTNGVSVQNFKVERDGAANRYRYRLLLTHKSQRAQDFKGQGLMNVSLERNGKLSTMTLKQGVAGTSVVELRFKYYQQIEGTFQLEDGAVIKKVEFVVFEDGKDAPMLTSAAALS